MTLDASLPVVSMELSQIPAESEALKSSIKVEEQEPLSAFLPISNNDKPHTAVQQDMIKSENTLAGTQQPSQDSNNGGSGAATTETANADQHPSTCKGEDDADFDEDLSNEEETTEGLAVPASDSTTDKKRMKRFRLTHNQTRFLMSEFTRQAHPDASHRERLSREIPGLSPRQVQVWFQNRRAKLKRLTSQDRDRVLKSRALPDHFDRSKMLHHPYEAKTGSGSSSSGITESASSSGARNGVKPLEIDTLKSASTDGQPISNVAASTYDNYIQSPATANSMSESVSPTSNCGNRSPFTGDSASLPGIAGMHQPNYPGYARSHSLSTSYIGSWQQFHTHSLPMPSSNSCMKVDAMNNVLRPGMSYSDLASSISEASSYDRNPSLASSESQSEVQPGLACHGQSHHVQDDRFTPSTHAVAESPVGFSPISFRPFPPLQTDHLPPAVDYQVSPFTTTFNSYDPFYQYAQESASAVSLPASYMRAEASFSPLHNFPS